MNATATRDDPLVLHLPTPDRADDPQLFLSVLLAAGLACDGDALSPLPAGGERVLFIGNSLTYENDLPRASPRASPPTTGRWS